MVATMQMTVTSAAMMAVGEWKNDHAMSLSISRLKKPCGWLV